MTAQRHLLWAYFGILLTFIILMYIIGITALANRGNAITSVLDKRWEYLYDHNPKHIRDLEDRYECCGLMFLDDRAYLASSRFGTKLTAFRPMKSESSNCSMSSVDFSTGFMISHTGVMERVILRMRGQERAFSILLVDQQVVTTILADVQAVVQGKCDGGWYAHKFHPLRVVVWV
ncbi:hypothetical protein HDU85_004657 [Gaertneriomyces sp. JEL0708]|nr:hypothetical protein HDU85_004657 [Gaertneriomyces sp. JEL0708]